jgi:transcriptional regulator with XRE-family HTH domain
MKSAFLRELDEIFDGVVDDHEVAKWGVAIDIATQFSALRERRGLSQAQVAELVGKTQQAISRIENPTHAGHNLAVLRKVVEALGAVIDVTIVPMEDLEAYQELFPPKPTIEDIHARLEAERPATEAKVSPLPQQPARPRRRKTG